MVIGAYTGPDAVGPSVATDHAGLFALHGLRAHRVTLQVLHRGTWLHPVQVREGFPNGSPDLIWYDLPPGVGLRDVLVKAPLTGSIGGGVVDEGGHSVPGVRVTLSLKEQAISSRAWL